MILLSSYLLLHFIYNHESYKDFTWKEYLPNFLKVFKYCLHKDSKEHIHVVNRHCTDNI